VIRLAGEYDGPTEYPVVRQPEQCVVFAGRHIREKRVIAIPPAVARARQELPDLRGLIIGDGPERPSVLEHVAAVGLDSYIEVPGFVPATQVEEALANALCLLLPSRREGYGMVVLEAAAHGTPSIVVAGEDNAATELVEEGENGFVAPTDSAENLAEAICRVHDGGEELRVRTAAWFARNIKQLSLETSLQRVTAAYRSGNLEGR
jgi:glycosyltransferase involved in cell wall biosynthesis